MRNLAGSQMPEVGATIGRPKKESIDLKQRACNARPYLFMSNVFLDKSLHFMRLSKSSVSFTDSYFTKGGSFCFGKHRFLSRAHTRVCPYESYQRKS